jgi:hypothetical protein
LRKSGGDLRMLLGQRIAHLLSQPPVVLVDALRLDTGPVTPEKRPCPLMIEGCSWGRTSAADPCVWG